MNRRVLSVLGVMLAWCLLLPAALAQFAEKNAMFSAPGPGDPNRIYHFRVPQGVTIVTPKIGTFTGGETIGIPGKYIEMLSPEQGETMLQTDNAFVDKTSLQTMTPAEKQNFAVIALTIPEGVTISRDDGRELQGEATAYLLVYAESMLATDPMEQAPEEYQKPVEGFESK